VRTGLIDVPAYLGLLGKTINGVLRGSGRRKQSVAESSFDAWVKYYRQDENAPNAIVSYYTKGSLVALGLDLTIRHETGGRKSLDDVMRTLWQRYGKQFYSRNGGKGIAEDEVLAVFEEVSGIKLKRYFERYISGTEDVPLQDLLVPFAVSYADAREAGNPGLGIRVTRGSTNGDAKVASVYEGGAGHRAGLSAGDQLLALDGIRIPAAGPDSLLARYRNNDVVQLHVFRRDELLSLALKLRSDDVPQVRLTAAAKPVAEVRKRRAWLGS